MHCLLRSLTLVALAALLGAPANAQSSLRYVRLHTPPVVRTSPFAQAPQPASLTADQRWAISSTHWPQLWAAPAVPPGTVLTVPPRPNWQPQPGEYWGPFTNDTGGWGFQVGPLVAPPPPPAISVPRRMSMGYSRLGLTFIPPAPPEPPAPPQMPLAGPVSPDGQMVVTYPDGGQVTWQFPMVEYHGIFNGVALDGTLALAGGTGSHEALSLARAAILTLNGRLVDRSSLPPGALATARALAIAPAEITVLELTIGTSYVPVPGLLGSRLGHPMVLR